MNCLVDTNIILDVLLKRLSFYHNSAQILRLSKQDGVNLFISASAVTDIFYIANQTLKNKTETINLIQRLVKVVSIASVSENEIRHALTLLWKDFEDSVQYSVARLQKMDGIITRNPNDYKKAEINIWTPEEFLLQFEQKI